MGSARPGIVVVVPCFNEARRLPGEELLRYAAEHPDVRLLLVDDGSRDGTRAVLEDLAVRSAGGLEVLALEENGGKAEAVRRGVRRALEARPFAFGFWDADLATPLAEIEVFAERLAQQPELLLVMGSRFRRLGSDIRRGTLRHYVGRVFATLASLALGLPVYDTQCGAKLFRNTPATRWALRAPFLSRWLFDVEILARLGLLGRRRPELDPLRSVYEHPLATWHDVAGSKIRPFDGLRALVELLRIGVRYRCGRSARARPIQ